MKTKMIQVRNVPEEVHRTLKVRAAQEGLSLSDYILREISRAAGRPTLDELVAAMKADGSVTPSESSAEAVRRERAAR
jgi:plasmid stability protein